MLNPNVRETRNFMSFATCHLSNVAAKSRKGFTLLETVIVIAIIGVVAVVAIPSFGGIVDQGDLDAASKKIYSDLAAARGKAMSGVVPAGGTGQSEWGICFVNGATDDYYGFIDASTDCDSITSESCSGIIAVFIGPQVCLPRSVSLSIPAEGSTKSFMFNKIDGSSMNADDYMKIVSRGDSRSVVVSSAGKISINSFSVVTNTASSVASASATLRGYVNPNDAATTVWFRYGISNASCSSLANATTSSSVSAGVLQVAFSANLTGLASGTPHYFCGVADNGRGVIYGNVLSFTTLSS